MLHLPAGREASTGISAPPYVRHRQESREVFTVQTLPACDEPFDDGVGKVAGFSLHAGVAARADQRRGSSGCEGISVAQPSPKSACLSRRRATSGTN